MLERGVPLRVGESGAKNSLLRVEGVGRAQPWGWGEQLGLHSKCTQVFDRSG